MVSRSLFLYISILQRIVPPPKPETEPDLLQSQISFFFLYHKKSGITTGNGGNSNFCFLYGSVFGGVATADGGWEAGIGSPIVQS